MSQDPSIARRDLLRAGAALVGASAAGLLPALARADGLRGVSRPSPIRQGISGAPVLGAPVAPPVPISVGYWSGGRFVDAASLPSGDAHLGQVRLTVTSVGSGGIEAMEANAPVPSLGRVPYIVWVKRPQGVARSSAQVVTEEDGGVALNLFQGGRQQVVHLGGGRSAGAKLRTGTYVLVAGSPDWNSLSLDAEGRLVVYGAIASTHLLVKVDGVGGPVGNDGNGVQTILP